MLPITGSWFEFRHHSPWEGKYYNPVLRAYSAAQWKAMVEDMHLIGMDILVLTCSSIAYETEAESYAPVDVFPAPEGMACPQAMDVMMETAAALGMKVFLSVGFYGNWVKPLENMASAEVEERAFRAVEEMYKAYGDNPAFYGWYLPDETEAGPYFSPVFLDYVARYAKRLRALDPEKKLLIAPYGTNKIVPDDTFVAQLRELDVDFIAYQDEVGVEKSTADDTGSYYAGLRRAHDRAGRSRLWADMEIFRFEDKVYRSALLPADIGRIRAQMEAVSPHVDRILVYAYPGMMARPGSIAGYGEHTSPEKLYADYQELLKTL
ncbi:MAG: DUF4434 domain-containing protein [Clostridia bacterium]|nr:DUF4434 domain-containing protein [Clostridia bacterium]